MRGLDFLVKDMIKGVKMGLTADQWLQNHADTFKEAFNKEFMIQLEGNK